MVRPAVLLPALLCLLCIAPSASAAGAPWYQIEVIVFTRPGAVDQGAGSASDAPELAAIQRALRLRAPGSAAAFSLLPSDNLRLAQEYARLRSRQSPLHPVLHVAWRQPVRGRGNAEAVYLSGGPELAPPAGAASGPGSVPQIEGTLRVGVARYLHLDLDLLLRKPATPESGTAGRAGTSPERGLKTYRLDEVRRARSGELHYFDHPQFGALVLITPWGNRQTDGGEGAPADEPAEPEEGDAPTG